ncbi:hypothetical protein [Caballeronia sp. LjRoot31]|uniref:hypothetical protein n=1 Tax=Caballeronia sp. LjRoot31 TaxID=3342324 RepID=UPI003ED1446F
MTALSNVEISCLPGAMSAHAGQASRAVANLHIVPHVELKLARKRRNPPPAIKVVSAIDLTQYGAYRERQRLNRRLCHGHIEAAELYQEILDPFLRKHKAGDPMVKNTRDGVYWWGRSWEKYAAKMHWTERQVKYRLKQLREFGLIATRMAKTPFNMLQVRPLVAEGAAYLTGTPDASNYPGLKSESEPQSLTGQGTQPINCPQAVGQDLSSGSKTKIVPIKALGLQVGLKEVGGKPPGDKNNPESKSKPVDASLTTTHASPETASGKSCVLSQKPNQDKSKSTPETESTPAPYKQPNTAPKKARTSSYVDDCYRAMREHHPDSFMPFKKAHRNNLSSLAVRLHKSGRLQARGTDEHAFLQWVFGDGWYTCALEFGEYWSLEKGERVPARMWPDVEALFGAAGEANLKMAVNLFLNDLEQQQHALPPGSLS